MKLKKILMIPETHMYFLDSLKYSWPSDSAALEARSAALGRSRIHAETCSFDKPRLEPTKLTPNQRTRRPELGFPFRRTSTDGTAYRDLLPSHELFVFWSEGPDRLPGNPSTSAYKYASFSGPVSPRPVGLTIPTASQACILARLSSSPATRQRRSLPSA